MELIQRLIARWTEHGIVVPSGASAADISGFESRSHGILPDDLRCYFTAVNGMGERGTIDNDFFSFWQLSDVESIVEYVPDRYHCLPNASRYFIVADHSVGLPSFAACYPAYAAIRRPLPPSSPTRALSNWKTVSIRFPTFFGRTWMIRSALVPCSHVMLRIGLLGLRNGLGAPLLFL